MAGYGTNTAEMATTANGIRTAADDVSDQKAKLDTSDFAAADFGKAPSHQQHLKPFEDLLTKLSGLAKAQHDAMDDYANRLDGSQGGYEFGEDVNAGEVTDAGRR